MYKVHLLLGIYYKILSVFDLYSTLTAVMFRKPKDTYIIFLIGTVNTVSILYHSISITSRVTRN